MYKEIKYIFPQHIDTSVSTILRADTITYYNFNKGGFNKNTEEDKLSLINTIQKQKKETLIQYNYNNINFNKQINVLTETSKETNFFINKILTPIFDTNINYENESGIKYLKHPTTDKRDTNSNKNNFTGHKVSNYSYSISQFNSESRDWIIILILTVLFVFSWVRLTYFKTIQQIIKSSYNFQLTQKFFREHNSVSQRVFFILNIIFILNISLFMCFALSYYNIEIFGYKGFVLYLTCCGILTAIYTIKLLIYKFLGFVLLSSKYFLEYIFNFFIYQKILGLVILPVIIGIPFMPHVFTPFLIKLGLLLIILNLILRTLRGIVICLRLKVSILYIFLYLCTLEILPVFIFIKILSL